jgi:hypothetical protein
VGDCPDDADYGPFINYSKTIYTREFGSSPIFARLQYPGSIGTSFLVAFFLTLVDNVNCTAVILRTQPLSFGAVSNVGVGVAYVATTTLAYSTICPTSSYSCGDFSFFTSAGYAQFPFSFEIMFFNKGMDIVYIFLAHF